MGGGDFRIDLSHKSDNDTAFVYIDNWRHYTTFQMWNCIPSPSEHRPDANLNTATTTTTSTTTTGNTNDNSRSNKRRYIMSIYTRYFENTNRFNRLALTAISNHYLYHYCALDLTYYEISVRTAVYMYTIVWYTLIHTVYCIYTMHVCTYYSVMYIIIYSRILLYVCTYTILSTYIDT